MSGSVRPHRQQPTRLPCPWDSPGKNTGVGCHFLLQCIKVKSESEVAQSCPTLSDPMDCMQPTRLLHPWDFPGKSTGVGCHCLLLIIMLLAIKSILTLFLDWWFVLHSKLMLLPKEDIIHEENNLKYTAYLFYWPINQCSLCSFENSDTCLLKLFQCQLEQTLH